MTNSRSESRQAATWDQARQQAYRARHPERVVVLHFLLDASSSIAAHEAALRAACNRYLQWLRTHGPAMALVDVRAFGSTVQDSQIRPLHEQPLLSSATYSATYGGTALYDALGQVGTQTPQRGQHILVCFSDGEECSSEHWSASQVHTLLTTLQDDSGWLCVFLGAFPEALSVAQALGFKAGNCLTFASERIPHAFDALRRATERYLTAPAQARKLLAQGGVFTLEDLPCQR